MGRRNALGQLCPPGTYPVGPAAPVGPPPPAYVGGQPPVLVKEGVPRERLGSLPAETREKIERVMLAGGSLSSRITHPSLTFFEVLWRKLPEQGIHSASVDFSHPISIQMGAYQVAKQQALLIFDFRPDVYTFSGIDPYDWVPVAERRFAGQMGWDVTVGGQHPANTHFQLQPSPRQLDVASNDAQFAQVRANAFGTALGTGTALQPQRPTRYGPQSLPLTLWVKESTTFVASANIFRRILFPIAFFEFDFAGLLMPANLAAQIFNFTDLRGGARP